jgi:hypothetical protein
MYNDITTLEDANFYVEQYYGCHAILEEFTWLDSKQKPHTKYHFVNVPPIQNYPKYGFKNVKSAMNSLYYHESGALKYKKKKIVKEPEYCI